jgi:hypothetical protein
MQFQLKRLVLWPRAGESLAPAVTEFRPGAVNVLSGVSRTGKSAVIPIIDYCLGASQCAIPVNTIRKYCGWFGVVVLTSEGEKLLARREPGQARTTSEMFVLEGDTVEIPHAIPGRNTTSDAVKSRLDLLAGLTLLDFDPANTGGGLLGRPSFRDMMAFCFQPQNIIANQNVLFFGADSHIHREKLRTVFPYILGAVTAELLAKQHRLAESRKTLARKSRELATVREVSERWLAEMQRWVAEARELGLLPPDASSRTEARRDALIALLREALSTRGSGPAVSAETIEATGRDLVALRREESAAATEAVRLRGRLHEMQALRDSTEQFRDGLELRREHLKVADWLSSLGPVDQRCPVCGQGMAGAEGHLSELLQALRAIEQSAGQYERVPAAFDRELERVRRELTVATEKLAGTRLRIQALTDESARSRQQREASYRTDRFVGRLEQALAQLDELGEDRDLAGEVERLQDEVASLSQQVREEEVARRRELALRTVSGFAQRLLPLLDVENPEDLASLSIDDLSVKVSGQDGDYSLWEIGSGSNWLSYHLAFSLALQQFFVSQKHSPVPSFIVFDQPSQVYFPKKLAENARQTDDLRDAPDVPYENDEDVIAVRKAFQVLADVAHNTAGRLQLIVLDHAASTVWGDIPGIHPVVDWRDGRKLVPMNWIEEA